jgi:hypothetical protein
MPREVFTGCFLESLKCGRLILQVFKVARLGYFYHQLMIVLDRKYGTESTAPRVVLPFGATVAAATTI